MSYINKSNDFAPTLVPIHPSTSTSLDQVTIAIWPNSGNEACTPYKLTNSTVLACDYIKRFADICEGGGYFMWTEYVVCEESDVVRYFLLSVAIIVLLILFLAMSSAADDFFCPSISAIVDHLKISQSVAGITFMAFGNGAPDIFSTIASVLNTKHPKAGLAIGDLLGGGAFVTTIVLAAVIIVNPFQVSRRPTFRDIAFYLIGIAWMAFIMLYDSKLYIWQPAAYLALYLLYVSTVFFGRIYRKIERKKTHYHRSVGRSLSNHSRISELRADNLSLSSLSTRESAQHGNSLMPPRLSVSSLYATYPDTVNPGNAFLESQSVASLSASAKSQFSFNSPIPVMMEPMPAVERNPNFVIPSIVISPVDAIDGHVTTFRYQDGRFKYEEQELDYDSDDSGHGMVVVVPSSRRHSGRRYSIMSLSDARSHKASLVAAPLPSLNATTPVTVKRIVKDLLTALYPLNENFSEASRFSKILQIIKCPILVLFRMTIPETDLWCKPLSIIHTFTMPMMALTAFGVLTIAPIPGGPGLWVYFLPFSSISTALLIKFTDYNKEPKYHKNMTAYLGFVMSVSWIYAVSSEVVNIISMISVVSRLSHEILGLTVMAWSTSIGDLVADISVAKQGFSQMAASAAIGGPLFNLLIGFGASFFIATATGKKVNLQINTIKGLLLILIAVSLLSTQVILIINKLMKSYYFCLGLIFTALFTGIQAEDSDPDDIPTEQYIPPSFVPPTIKQNEVYFVDWFDNRNGIGTRWIKSTAKKDGIDENLAMYNGEWYVGSPANVIIEEDYGLVVKTRARHHAIASVLREPFDFSGKPLILQYEVKYEEGQECGGGYVKLLSAGIEKKISSFTDKTPYTIMFGPDKCGQSAKVHFIIKLKNPKNGTISEHSIKESASKNVISYFEDKMTHLYTLKVTPDNRFSVQIDNYEIISGNLLKDLVPTIEPPKEIHDPEDKKPEDWDEREFIADETATKPDDWDESQPKEIVDASATMPSDWLEDEESLIFDPEAVKPDDWDVELDGEWEPKLIPNPKCASVSGCGKWNPPMKPNPLYKGKWSPPMIKNPDYKGKWSPKLIENPHYYEPDPYKQLEKITAIGIELWTMSSGIVFDNILIADDEELAHRFAAETFTIKKNQEEKYAAIKNPSKGIFQSLIDATEDKPWLWAVYTVALLIPTILISVLCFGRKTTPVPSKKTDEIVEDDFEPEEEVRQEDIVDIDAANVEISEEAQPEEEQVDANGGESDNASQKSGKSSAEPSPKTRQRRPRKE